MPCVQGEHTLGRLHAELGEARPLLPRSPMQDVTLAANGQVACLRSSWSLV